MATESIFCDQCGQQSLRNTSKFCSSCGTELPNPSSGDTPVISTEDTKSSAPEPPDKFQRSEEFTVRSGARGAIRWMRRQQRQQRRNARSESAGNDDPSSTEPGPRDNLDNQGWQQYIPRPLWNSDLLRDYREHVQKTREETEAYKIAHGGRTNRGFLNNPISLISGFVIIWGWLWAISVCFSATDNPILWILSIFIAPVFMFYEGFIWGQWAPVAVMLPGFAISNAGKAIGPRPTLWRISLAVLFGLSIYFLPFGVALLRNKREKLAIFLLNIFGGWTGLLWIVALVWAAIPRRES